MLLVWVKKKTPTPFISACEKFKYLEVLAGSITKNINNIDEVLEKQPLYHR